MRTTTLLLALLVTPSLAPEPVAADTVVEGRTAGGAYYMAVVPDAWNGDLVIWNHGFDLGPVEPLTLGDMSPLAPLQLAQGYAIAASSYRQIGWALFKSDRDLELMVNAFAAAFGAPAEVIVTGASLGGAVTASALERANLGNVVGAYTACGAVAGSRNWDGAIDIRLIYDVICAGIPEAAIPGGGLGLPAGSAMTPDEVDAAANACLGVLVPKSERSRKQKRNLRKFLKHTGIPEEFVITDMGYVTFALRDLIQDRRKLKGKQGLGNENVVYGNRKIDREIERVKPKRNAARKLARNFTPKGEVGGAKIVNLHTARDGLVIVENQSEYAKVVPRENLTVAVVAESEPSHCGFSVAESAAGWEALREWIGSGVQPTAADIQDLCELLAPIVGGPCRFDPSHEIGDMDDRIRPRE